jgi:hypothetical protein
MNWGRMESVRSAAGAWDYATEAAPLDWERVLVSGAESAKEWGAG